MDHLLRNSSVLVTGGAGFIGSNLVESLLMAGNRVTCLDNFSTGTRNNLAEFLSDPGFRLVEGDIRNTDDCRKSLSGIEYVFHEAALGSVPRSIKDPVSTTDVNVGGFVKMLFAAREAGVKRFIYASSSSVYGDNADLPKAEEKTGVPLSPYAISKCADELFASNFARLFGMEIIGLRYFNVFGRRQDPEGAYAAVIPRFIMSLLEHNPPMINGDGSYSRDFTYIDSVLQANHLAALAENPGAINQVYNIAHGGRTTLNQLFELIRGIIGSFDNDVLEIEAIHGPDRDGDIPHSLASIEKASRLLGYAPSVDIREGLEETLSWFQKNL
ncbi:MAG: SDR family oxidoreductase [Bacteroidales bacterium]|jgi:UDP-N-acetylglucosamine 4-epimerase